MPSCRRSSARSRPLTGAGTAAAATTAAVAFFITRAMVRRVGAVPYVRRRSYIRNLWTDQQACEAAFQKELFRGRFRSPRRRWMTITGAAGMAERLQNKGDAGLAAATCCGSRCQLLQRETRAGRGQALRHELQRKILGGALETQLLAGWLPPHTPAATYSPASDTTSPVLAPTTDCLQRVNAPRA
eukprot:COSAG01_NODE_18984_length_1039_cov_1.063830_2_plen_186_part_00